jgi:hypothetical protein
VEVCADIISVHRRLCCCRRQRLGLPYIHDPRTQVPEGGTRFRRRKGWLYIYIYTAHGLLTKAQTGLYMYTLSDFIICLPCSLFCLSSPYFFHSTFPVNFPSFFAVIHRLIFDITELEEMFYLFFLCFFPRYLSSRLSFTPYLYCINFLIFFLFFNLRPLVYLFFT